MTIRILLMLMLIFSPIARGSVHPLAFCSMQALTLLMLSIWFFKMSGEGCLKFRRTQLDIPVVFFIAIAAVSIFRSVYKYDAMVEFLKLLNIIAIFYLVVNNMEEKKDMLALANLIVTLGAVLSLFGIVQYVGGITNSWWSHKGFLSSVYVNHNHFAGFLEMCIPLCVGLVLAEERVEKKIFYIYLAAIMLLAFVFSMSRGAWFSLSISMLVMFILLLKKGLVRINAGFFIAASIVAAAGFFAIKNINFTLFLSRMSSYKDLDLSGRLEIWKGALGIIKGNPFFGAGLGNFIYYFPEYRPLGFNLFANYAHNDYLQAASEMGIFGLMCMIFMIFLVIRKGMLTYLISHTRAKKALAIGAITGILSMAIHSLADFNLNIPANAVLFAVISGIAVNLRSKNEPKPAYISFPLDKTPERLLRPLLGLSLFLWALFIGRVIAAEAITAGIDGMAFDNKIRALNRAVVILPETTGYHKGLAQVYLSRAYSGLNNEGDIMVALENYKRAIKLNPRDAWAWMGMGESYLYLNMPEKAESAYKEAIALDPNNSYYLKKYGDLLAMKKDSMGAAGLFKKAAHIEKNRRSRVTVDENPGKPEFYAEKGSAYYKNGRLEDALNMYRIASLLGPEKEDIKIAIANILERTGKKEGVNEDAGSMSLNIREKVIFLNSRARYFISRGEYQEAGALLEKALSMDSDNPVTLRNKIDILQREKEPFDIVRPYMERLVALNKDASGIRFSDKNIVLDFELGKKGFMAASGSSDISFSLPVGLIGVKVFAVGTAAKNEWPHMLVKMNSNTILSTYVNSDSIVEFDASGISTEADGVLSVEFSNDYWDRLSGEDRNLEIKKIVLEYKYPDYL